MASRSLIPTPRPRRPTSRGTGKTARSPESRDRPETRHTTVRKSTQRTSRTAPGHPDEPGRGPGRRSAQGEGNVAAIYNISGSEIRQNADFATTGRLTLLLFAALAVPGPGKPTPTLEREPNRTGFRGKRHGSVRYFQIEGPCFRRFPGTSGDFLGECRKISTHRTRS